MELRVGDDPAGAAGRWLARRLRDAVRRRGTATLAVSGGSTAPAMFAALRDERVPWEQLTIWQVDERVVADDHPERNARQLAELPAHVRVMPVTAADLRAATRRYAAALPDRFDVVHLGLGADGHTASWPPGDPVVDSERACEVVATFNGFRRMTLTPLVVNAARARLVLATGTEKASPVARWVRGDADLPIARVRRSGTWTFLDRAAAQRLPGGR